MIARDFLRPAIRELSAYQPEPSLGESALDANENPYAPPLEFQQRALKSLASLALNRYPDPACRGLLAAAAEVYALPSQCLLAGNGSDEFIALLFTAFGGGKRRCLIPTPSFSMYALCARAAGWEVLEEGLDEAWGLTRAFVERAKKERPHLILLASPNNPTGNCFDRALVDELLALDCVVVLDEAYAEFSPESRLGEVRERKNLICLRTLSKAFGLAGLRLGFLAAEPGLVAELDKVRLPYNIDVVTQELGALALSMAPQFSLVRKKILADKLRLEKGIRAIPGATCYPSDANFFLFRHSGAAGLHRHLLARGLRLRRFGGDRLKDCLRVSVGTTEEVDRLLAAFQDWTP